MKLWRETCTFIREEELNCKFIYKMYWLPCKCLSLYGCSQRKGDLLPLVPVDLLFSWEQAGEVKRGDCSGTGCSVSPRTPCCYRDLGSGLMHGSSWKQAKNRDFVVACCWWTCQNWKWLCWKMMCILPWGTNTKENSVGFQNSATCWSLWRPHYESSSFFIKNGLFHGYL